MVLEEIDLNEFPRRRVGKKQPLISSEARNPHVQKEFLDLHKPVSVPVFWQFLASHPNIGRYKSQLTCQRLAWGNKFVLFHRWKYMVFDASLETYIGRAVICSTKNDLEEALFHFLKDWCHSQVSMLIHEGRDINDTCRILAYQLPNNDCFSVLKAVIRAVCEHNVGRFEPENVDIFGISYRSRENYGVLKVYVSNLGEDQAKVVSSMLRNRLPRDLKGFLDTVRML